MQVPYGVSANISMLQPIPNMGNTQIILSDQEKHTVFTSYPHHAWSRLRFYNSFLNFVLHCFTSQSRNPPPPVQ